jgi:glycine dehydrogenase subunit 1
LIGAVKKIPGVGLRFASPVFHEVLLTLPVAASSVLDAMAREGIDAGFDVSNAYPSLKNTLLVCVTETKSSEDIARYASVLHHVLAKESVSC